MKRLFIFWQREGTVPFTPLLVYCYLAREERFGRDGMSGGAACFFNLPIERIEAALATLAKLGMARDAKPIPRPDLFFPRQSQDPHWTGQMQFWTLSLPDEGATMQTALAAIYCMRAKLSEGGKRYNAETIGRILGMKPDAVAEALELLDLWGVPATPVDERFFERVWTDVVRGEIQSRKAG